MTVEAARGAPLSALVVLRAVAAAATATTAAAAAATTTVTVPIAIIILPFILIGVRHACRPVGVCAVLVVSSSSIS